MDKQKQIDEMARILTLCPRNTCVGCGMECIDYRMAKAIYNAGYRKIPENAVILETSVYESLDTKLYRDIITEKVHRETAEKFAEMADKRIAQCQGKRDGYEAFTIDDKAKYDGDIVSLALFEILKEITEGKYGESLCEE